MLKEFLRRYFAVPLIYRVGAAFVVGVLAGIVISRMGDLYGPQTVEKTVAWIAPFGNALIAMLKMIVIPIIFFSLVSGAASLPIRKFGRLGTSVLGWYIFTSLFATVFGVILAMILNPRMQNAMEISGHLLGQVRRMKTAAAESGGFSAFLEGLGDYDSKRIIPLVIQKEEDEIQAGVDILRSLWERKKSDVRTLQPMSKLRIGLKCGASDAFRA